MAKSIIHSRIRNSFNTQISCLGWGGVGVTVIFGALPYVGWDISKLLARGFFFIGIALIIFALVLAYLNYRKLGKKQIYTIEAIAETLRNINDRMTVIKDLQLRKKITLNTFKNASELILDAFGIVKLGKLTNKLKRIKESIEKLNNEKLNEQELIRSVSQQFKQAFKSVKTDNLTMRDCIKISHILDGCKIGLAKLRDKDKSYIGLNMQMETIKDHYADKELNNLIEAYLLSSYGINSYALFSSYSVKFDKYKLIEKMYPELIQNDWLNIKTHTDGLMTDLRTQIINRIKILQGQESKNDTAKT